MSRVLGTPCGQKRPMLEGRRQEIALQHTRIKRNPAGAGIGQAHGRHPLVFQTPRRDASARTGNVGISVPRSMSRRRLMRMTPGSGSTVRSGA